MGKILMLIGIIIVFLIAVAVIRLLFESFLLSRILSILCAAAVIIQAIGGVSRDEIGTLVFLTVLSWLFYRGEAALETYDIGFLDMIDLDSEVFESFGGLLGNAILPAILSYGLYAGLGGDYPVVYFLVPGLILGLDAFSLYMEW